MAYSERYQVDIYTFFMIILLVALAVTLLVTAIYFYNLMKNKYPSNAESVFLFWGSIIFIFIVLAFIMYSLYRIIHLHYYCI